MFTHDLHESSSSFHNHSLYQHYHELLGQKSPSSIWCIKVCINLNGTRMACWNGEKKLSKESKNGRKIPVEEQHFYKQAVKGFSA